jgi:glycosyltransferase involved in cell wall biosynthesis
MTRHGKQIYPSVLLCVVTGNERYGVRQVWSDIFDGFQAHGWDIVVAVLEARNADAWRAAYPGVKIVPSPRRTEIVAVAPGRWSKLLSMARRLYAQFGHASWLIRLARQSRASALIIQSPPETPLAGVVARRVGLRALWLVPGVISFEVPFDLNRRAYRSVFRFGKVVPVSNSRHTDSTLGPGSFERHVVHLGVDTDRFQPSGDAAPVRAAFGIPKDASLIGLFASMSHAKGQDRLIQALAQSGTPFHLLLCGGPLEGSYVESLRRHIETLGLGGRVHLAGPQTDLRPYYAACDVMASIYAGAEGFGLTIIEAMACGKPVFAHGLGGPSEIILDGETGWLLPDAEVATIAAALRRIWPLREHWQSMGKAGLARVAAGFTKQNFIARIAVLAKGGAPSNGWDR